MLRALRLFDKDLKAGINKNKKNSAPKIDEKLIVEFFTGAYEKRLNGGEEIEKIRSIETHAKNTDAHIFYRDKEGKIQYKLEREAYKPFVFAKTLNFKNINPYRIVEISGEYVSTIEGEPRTAENANYVILPNGKTRPVELGKVEVWERKLKNDNESFVVFYRFETMAEFAEFDAQKKEEYGIIAEHLKTNYNHQDIPDRLFNGFKEIYYITPPLHTSYSDNPYFNRKIKGSFHDLRNFFAEMGISLYGDIYFNHAKFITWFNGLTKQEKIKTFFLCYAYKQDFFPFEIDSMDKRKFVDKFQQIRGFRYHTMANLNDEIEKKWEKIYTLADNFFSKEDFDEIFDIRLNMSKIRDYVTSVKTFRDSLKGMRGFLDYFREQDVCFWDEKEKFTFSIPVESQYMIQTGKRINKGIENYEDMKVLVLDIETTALDEYLHLDSAALHSKTCRIFEVGLWTNKGDSMILSAKDTVEEAEILQETWKIIGQWNPDIILTHNGESFDWKMIEERMEILGLVEEEEFRNKMTAAQKIRSILEENLPYGSNDGVFKYFLYNRKQNQTLKVGGTTEDYTQTNGFGLTYCDTRFAVKRAMAQNKNIPNAKLKDNIKFAKLASDDRVYVDGDKIGSLSADKRKYYYNRSNGEYHLGEIGFKGTKKQFLLKNSKDKSLIKVRYDDTPVYNNPNELYFYTYREKDGTKHLPNISVCDNVVFLDYSLGVEKAVKHAIYQLKAKLNESKKYEYVTVSSHKLFDCLTESEKKYAVKELGDLRKSLSDVKNVYDLDFKKFELTTGKYLVQRYLEGDLEEPYLLDKLYSQKTFAISKFLPISYQRVATMGDATIWKLLLTTWYFLSGVAIPDYEEHRDYGGGLIAMTSSGFHVNGVKVDFSSLYPAIYLWAVQRANFDVTGIYHNFVRYVLTKRYDAKAKKNEAKKNGDKKAERLFDNIQLPLKILVNSFYGMLGAARVSPYAHIDSAHHITAAGRRAMTHIIKYFTKRGFKIVYFHTDGANFTMPKGAEDYTYTGKGLSRLVETGKVYKGIAAYVAEYNDKFMRDMMGLDIDEYFDSCINFAKSNFVYMQNGKLKSTGSAVLSKGRAKYLHNFAKESVIKLLKGESKQYLKEYFDYADKIYNNKVRVGDLAKPERITKTVEQYLEDIKGNSNRQPKMEIIINENLKDISIGEYLYLINVGDSKKDGPSNTDKDKIGWWCYETKSEADTQAKYIDKRVNLEGMEAIDDIVSTNSDSIVFSNPRKGRTPKEILENIGDYTDYAVSVKKHTTKSMGLHYRCTVYMKKYSINMERVDIDDLDTLVEYNSEFYLEEFKNATLPYLIAYKPEVRKKVLSYNPCGVRPLLKPSDYELVNGIPLEGAEDKQYSLSEVLPLDDLEVMLWERISKSPNYEFDKMDLPDNDYFIWDGKSTEIIPTDESRGTNVLSKTELIKTLGNLDVIEYEDVFYKMKNV